ncbi:kelch domain-containing protein 3 [Mortierella hygrophila]|uniref:Kelch domain-containing protein 3 n=1 Tax=Mortierella hygrophila TaxID=979708 RepID=A0A9P6K027_9FUNG|nr:kelch domain-containing protein 3 [Mortierella hygrophila]
MPCKRHNHSCVVEMNAIYVFGGQTVSDVYLGDFWRFDLDTRQWSELATSQPRHSHSALKHERSMVIFGGRTGLKPAVYSNEILVYNFDSNEWSLLYLMSSPSIKAWTSSQSDTSTPRSTDKDDQNPTAVAPHPRSYTSIVQCGQYLVVYGGYWWDGKEHYFDDTFGFSLDSHKWVKLSPLGDEPVPHSRNRHGALSLPAVADVGSMSGMIIFGGNFYSNRVGTDEFFGDAWLFGSVVGESLTSGRWRKVALRGDIPCPRGHPTWVEDDQVAGRSWMFGGEANRQRFNDLYEIRVEVSNRVT